VRISRVAKKLGVSPQPIRMLELQGRIPQARRDYNGRLYTEFYIIAVLRSMGIGARSRRLRCAEEILEVSR
jgi:DNA-binding transcriptional MerR regulator